MRAKDRTARRRTAAAPLCERRSPTSPTTSAKVIPALTFDEHLFENGDRRHIDEMERVSLQTIPAAVEVVPDDVALAVDDDQGAPRFGPYAILPRAGRPGKSRRILENPSA